MQSGSEATPQGTGTDSPQPQAEAVNDDTLSEEAVENRPEEMDDIEYEGKKYRVPKPLKGGFLMQADYTRKTQEVAERRREVERLEQAANQRAREQQSHFADVVKINTLQERLNEYDNVNWTALRQQDPALADAHFAQMNGFRRDLDRAKSELHQKQQNYGIELQRERARQVDETVKHLTREIKDWSPQLIPTLTDYGQKSFGLTPAQFELLNANPQLVVAVHRAYVNEQAANELAALKRSLATDAAKPVSPVGSSSQANARRTTDASGDRLSTEEWMKREMQRTAKRR